MTPLPAENGSVEPPKSGRRVWVGYETPGPSSIQKVTPNEVRVFATEPAARRWERAIQTTMTSPLRYVVEREVER